MSIDKNSTQDTRILLIKQSSCSIIISCIIYYKMNDILRMHNLNNFSKQITTCLSTKIHVWCTTNLTNSLQEKLLFSMASCHCKKLNIVSKDILQRHLAIAHHRICFHQKETFYNKPLQKYYIILLQYTKCLVAKPSIMNQIMIFFFNSIKPLQMRDATIMILY